MSAYFNRMVYEVSVREVLLARTGFRESTQPGGGAVQANARDSGSLF